MNKVIKVPLRTYVRTLSIVTAYVIVFALLTFFYLPDFKLNAIFLLGIGFYLFKVINYMAVSYHIKDNKSFVYNRFFKKGIVVPLKDIEEVDIEGPSQFNSNYRLAFYGRRNSNRLVLSRIPLYWYSRNEIVELLHTIRKKKPGIQIQKQVSQFLSGEDKKKLFVNYLIQNIILMGVIVIITMKYN